MLVKNISATVLVAVGFSGYAAAGLIDAGSLGARDLDVRQFGRSQRSGFRQSSSKSTTTTTTSNNGGTNTRTQSNNSGSNSGSNSGFNSGSNSGSNSGGLALDANNVQNASDSTGQAGGVAEAGQANSLTDPANFINFCTGKTLTNGAQVKAGSCNGIVMGDIPASTQMVGSMILNPAPNENLNANQDFTVNVAVSNLDAGSFTNAAATYYSAPQQVNPQSGNVVGHTHITIQDMGNSMAPQQALDSSVFAFFKGVNNPAVNGVLSATVAGGLPAGNYRVCTMASASNHQPVLMPVAQRGAQDDCTKFTVGASGSATSGNAASGTSSAVSSASSSFSSSTSNSNSNSGNNANTGNNQKQRTGGRNGRGRKNRNRN